MYSALFYAYYIELYFINKESNINISTYFSKIFWFLAEIFIWLLLKY